MGFASFQWPSICKVLGEQLAHGMSPQSIIFITNLFSQPHHFNSVVVSLFVFWWSLNACALHPASSHIIQLDFETWSRQEGTSWETHCGSSAVLHVCFCFSICGYVTPGWSAQKPCMVAPLLPQDCTSPCFVWDTGLTRTLFILSYSHNVGFFWKPNFV